MVMCTILGWGFWAEYKKIYFWLFWEIASWLRKGLAKFLTSYIMPQPAFNSNIFVAIMGIYGKIKETDYIIQMREYNNYGNNRAYFP